MASTQELSVRIRDAAPLSNTMALLTEFVCKCCGKTVTQLQIYDEPNTCGDCVREKKEADRTFHLNKLKNLPIEERIARLEAYLYDKNLDKRLERVEAINMRYG